MQTTELAWFSGMPGPAELLIILLVLILLFGARRLPELARSIGRSLSEFRRGRQEGAREDTADEDEDPKDKSSSN